MRTIGALFVLAGLICAQQKPLTPAQAAQKVLAAIDAEDQALLASLAKNPDPDPWLVADLLCAQGKHDAARAFAEAAPRRDIEKLPAYVLSRRGKRGDASRKALATALRAIPDLKAVLAALEGVDTSEGDVSAVEIQTLRGSAMRALGRLKESASAYAAGSEMAGGLGWHARAAAALHESAKSAYRDSEWKVAIATWERVLALELARGDLKRCAADHAYIGIVQRRIGKYSAAVDCFQRSVKIFEEQGDLRGAGKSIAQIGETYSRSGDHESAMEWQERALGICEKLNDRAGVALQLSGIGLSLKLTGQYWKALEYQERCLKLRTDLGDRRRVALTLRRIGVIHYRLGNYSQALAYQERSLAISEAMEYEAGVAHALGNIGQIQFRLGAYAKSLDYHERALDLEQRRRNRKGVARVLMNLGLVHHSLGDYDEALDNQKRALKIHKELRDRFGMAANLGNIGNIHETRGDYERALEFHRLSLELKKQLGNRAAVARALGNIGAIHKHRLEVVEALARFELALRLFEAVGDRDGMARTHGNIGNVHMMRSDFGKAEESYAKCLALAIKLGSLETQVLGLQSLAAIHLKQSDPAEAARAARRGVEKLPSLVGQLAEEQGATARDRWSGLLEHGVRAGVLLKSPGEVCYFVESGRAGALLEGLGGRNRLRSIAVPEELRSLEMKSRARESGALYRYRRALEAGDDAAALWTEVEAARDEILEVARRIQRDAKGTADLVYPEAAPLAMIQSALRDGEALVLYALMKEEASALVVTGAGARLVALGESEAIVKAARVFQASVSRPDERGMSRPAHETFGYARRRLYKLAVEPLRLKARRVLVSPDGLLSYVPFTVLLDREVAYVPSGTTYQLLCAEKTNQGSKVLALGDARGGDLTPLPESGKEATAVGDVVLLGDSATRAGLVAALSKDGGRWRAVHLACHGLIDPERPVLSSLALTGEPLRCLDVYRMKIPADLVVLSACETGKGKVYKAEGVIGWTRAFLFAGAPRVIVSLWKVDDAATRALMEKFYELWKPGKMPTATALKKAQEHVAAQPQWKHPYFWAAWQLWGLGE